MRGTDLAGLEKGRKAPLLDFSATRLPGGQARPFGVADRAARHLPPAVAAQGEVSSLTRWPPKPAFRASGR